jgi:hypothetical protein
MLARPHLATFWAAGWPRWVLDLGAIESCGREFFEGIKRRCIRCDFRRACEEDLGRDPYNPVWESYCPNSAKLIVLTQQQSSCYTR